MVSSVLTSEKQKCRGRSLSALSLFIQHFKEGRGQNIDPVYTDLLGGSNPGTFVNDEQEKKKPKFGVSLKSFRIEI